VQVKTAKDRRQHIQFVYHYKAIQMILFLEAGLLEVDFDSFNRVLLRKLISWITGFGGDQH
jgi:hypothetical protein